MSIYIVLLVFYIFVALNEKRIKLRIVRNDNVFNKKICLALLILPLFITVAFRSVEVGNDTTMYQYLFNRYNSLSYDAALGATSKEVGFVSLCYLCGKIGFDYFQFQILIAAITYIALFWYLYKHSDAPGLSLLVFICFLGYFRSMNISREILAMALSLNVIDYLIEKKKISYVIGIILISLIHRTVLVLLILVFVDFFRSEAISVFKKAIVVVACIIGYFSIDRMFSIVIGITGRYEYLVDSKYVNENGILAMIVLVIFTLMFMIIEGAYKKQIKEQVSNEYENKIVYRSDVVMFGYSICLIFCFVGFNFGLADRAVIYLSSLYMETITREITSGNNNIKYLKYIIFVSMIIYFIAVMLTRNSWQGTIPYRFWGK